jgi:hypothetical protein
VCVVAGSFVGPTKQSANGQAQAALDGFVQANLGVGIVCSGGGTVQVCNDQQCVSPTCI